MTSTPEGLLCVVPSRLAVGEEFGIKVKVRGPERPLLAIGNWNTPKPSLRGPFNLNVARKIQYMDNLLPQWQGRLRVDGGPDLEGGPDLTFDGVAQGVFPGDTRPIRACGGFRWKRAGLHFIRLHDPVSGVEGWSNPVMVLAQPPRERIYWGDPHWQTFFSDGIRCPEELYSFARDEAFLDFGAVSDHMEGVTDRQWDYFQAVTNDFNAPGRFATLIGQEWTNHNPAVGAPGHRNIYYRGPGGPVLRSTHPACNTLSKLWQALDAMNGMDAIAIPHHSANVTMGVDWEQGWNPKYEKAVEVYSVWGSSERSERAGNPRPIRSLKGEQDGRHVVDALKRGYRLGFVGGGDIHDGRPGDDMHRQSYPPMDHAPYPQGFTAAFAPALTREGIYDAIATRRTYAATKSRSYLDAAFEEAGGRLRLRLCAAAAEGIREAIVVRNGADVDSLKPDSDVRIVQADRAMETLAPDEFCYLRLVTRTGEMAWSSPVWGRSDG